MDFDENQVARYARHLVLREIGGPGQQRLRKGAVALVGLGGLGCPAALYLAAAGVGRLTLIDDDAVALSNLQRQTLFSTSDVGRAKVASGAAALNRLNPDVAVKAHEIRLTPENAEGLLRGHDLILDGTDSFAARFAVNDAALALGAPLISGAVGRWDGHVGVFAAAAADAEAGVRGPCYRCFVPHAPPDAEACETAGVLGALTGVIGAMMATEAVKILTRAGRDLSGRILIYDALSAETRVVRLPRDPDCPACGEGARA